VVGSESDCPPVLRVLSRCSGRTPALPYPPPKSGYYITEGPSAEKAENTVYYCGIDLHSDNNVLGVIDSTGNRLSIKRNANDLETVKRALNPFAENLEGIVVESTYNWYWLVDGLQEAGFKVHLANPAAIEQYSGLKHGDDETDTWWLAELLRLKLLKEGYVYPPCCPRSAEEAWAVGKNEDSKHPKHSKPDMPQYRRPTEWDSGKAADGRGC
jgi:hypothetical protein